MVVFESIFEKRLRLGKLCNGSRFVRTYTKCWTFENISCFESVWCVFVRMFVLKVSKQLRTFLPTQKSFIHFLLSFDIAILPLIGKKPYLWM